MKRLKYLFILTTLWMAGSIDVWAAVGDTFTATNTNGVNITYKVLTEEGSTGTVQVGTGEYDGPAIDATKWMEIDGSNYEVINIPEGEFVIPQTVSNGDVSYTVTAIGDYAFYEKGKTLTAINIPSTVTEIGEDAFVFSNLESVTLPEGLTSIGDEAFNYCTALQAIDIPQSVITIGESCFASCSQLKSVTLRQGNLTQIADDVFTGSGITSIVIPSGVTSIGSSAFSNCRSLQSVTLPNGLTSIGSSAFSNCKVLESLDIPSSVSELGSSFAQYCTQLATVTLHEGQLTEISDYAFDNSGITSITIPEGVNYIRTGAFMNCPSLKTAFIPSTVSSIELYAFYQCNVLEEVTIACDKAPTLPYRSDWVFSNSNGKVNKLKIPLGSNFNSGFKSLFTSWEELLMVGCKITVDEHNYRILTLPEGNTNGTVQLGAGFDNPGYEYGVYGEVTITDKVNFTYGDDTYTFDVTTLGEGSFLSASSLGGITIPASITLIKKEAIFDCPYLERVYVKSETPCTLEEDAFKEIYTNCMLVVPAGCKTAYQDSSWGSVFTKIKELGNEVEWPQLAPNQELDEENNYNKCEALTELTRWFPNSLLYQESNMWEMPHMMDGEFYVSAFWQSNNSSTMTESLTQNICAVDGYLQLCYNPAFLSPNYGLGYYDDGAGSGTSNHDDQAGATIGGFISFKVKGSGTIVVRGFTESSNAYVGICVQGKQPSYFSGTDDREYSYSYTLDREDDEAYAYVYGANLSINGRHAFIKYIKFVPSGVENTDICIGGISIQADSNNDALSDDGTVGFEWREYEEDDEDEDEEGGDGPEGSRRLAPKAASGGEGDGPSITPTRSKRYPVLILNNAHINFEEGPAIEVNSHERFLIELIGQNTIQTTNGHAAISMGTLQSEAWGGGTISIVGIGEAASLTIPAVEGVENGIYLAESSIHMENCSADISGTDYGVHFQGYAPSDVNNKANCNLTLGKGMSLKMQGGQEALSGFNPRSMFNLRYYDKEEGEWINYELLDSDLEDAQPQWSCVYGIHDGDEWVEDPEDPDGGYYVPLDTPAKYLYFGLPPTEVAVNISDYGMATFCSKYPLDFTNVNNVKAYIVTDFDNETNMLTLTRVYEVPEGTGLALYSTNGGATTAEVPIPETYSYDYDLFRNQLLIGCTRTQYITPEEDNGDCVYTNFVMSVKDGVPGFYRFTVDDSGTRKVEKGKAYLRLEGYTASASEGTRRFSIAFNDDSVVTGIADQSVPGADRHANSRYFNLNGQQVETLQKGLYIKNGKKMVVK